MNGRTIAAALITTAIAVAGCGSKGSKTTQARADLVVSAASSLKQAFTTYGDGFAGAHVRLSFAGSDMLAAQIRQGVRPDVFAAANTKLPDELHAAGLVRKPTIFAGNRLVIAVPAAGSKITALDDLSRRGVTIAAGSASVPVGAYTRKVLARLAPAKGRAILANIRSAEPDVAGVVGKLTQGAVDAGFVYITDVRGAGGHLKAIELPAALKPRVAYAIAVVNGAAHATQARAFIAGLLTGAGRTALHDAGFEPPPS